MLRFPRAGLAALAAACAVFFAVRVCAAAPVVVAPRAESALAAPYPDGAHGDAEVTLDLVVGRDGSVTSGTVAEGAEPFAGAALTAMKGWRFTPATRDGAPVAARIRVRIAFHAPASAPAPAPTPASAPAPAPAPASASAPAPTPAPTPAPSAAPEPPPESV